MDNNNNNKNNHNHNNDNNNINNNTTRHHHTTTNNRSMSDTDSQYDEFHSPLRSPLQPDDLPPSSPSKALVPVHYPLTKPVQPVTRPPPVLSYNLATREEPVTGVTKVNPSATGGGGGGGEEGQGGERRVRTTTPTRRVKREVVVERVGLGFRVMEVVLCLIAFSVMASDKTQGWSGDSFDRYKEYRYVVAVNAIAFAYAAFQAIEMTYRLIYNKHIISYSLRPVFDFLIDQILAYLLISASSSAATRVDDWVSNWGKDDFTEMATASIGMSFLAFLAFAVSALISGYVLCNQKSL